MRGSSFHACIFAGRLRVGCLCTTRTKAVHSRPNTAPVTRRKPACRSSCKDGRRLAARYRPPMIRQVTGTMPAFPDPGQCLQVRAGAGVCRAAAGTRNRERRQDHVDALGASTYQLRAGDAEQISDSAILRFGSHWSDSGVYGLSFFPCLDVNKAILSRDTTSPVLAWLYNCTNKLSRVILFVSQQNAIICS